jgi:hypothetical protein
MRLMFAFLSLLSILLLSSVSNAQLSPGDLSKAHQSQEGLKNCQSCHDTEKQISSEKCLACHKLLGEKVQSGKGLHAGADYRKCENCHVEHQGREYNLVFWKDGQKQFDHKLAGYALKGKHWGLDCRKCHIPEHIQTFRPRLESEKVDLKSTFLGLSQDCLGCHRDEHRGQLGNNCQTCHTMDSWKPASLFDHSKTKFILIGKHSTVACEKCHKLETDKKFTDDADYLKFDYIEYSDCRDCHQDFHNDKFKQACGSCHNPVSWQNVNSAQFDHNQTNYPLLGKHVLVACDKCHRAGTSMKGLKFAACTDCHSDYHHGRFAARPNKGGCEECHTLDGYSISKFTIAEHNLSKYPLEGSHLAVPCDLCHPKIVNGNISMVKFDFKSTRCLECHKNPHKNELATYINEGGCELCHKTESWSSVNFDHNKTKFPLNGRHSQILCGRCHKLVDPGLPTANRQFKGLTPTCQDCHQDNHRGQFAITIKSDLKDIKFVDCAKCHNPENWQNLKFVHNNDSSFKLEGAHIKVACRDCHKLVGPEGQKFILYKPLDLSCKSCHGNRQMQQKG